VLAHMRRLMRAAGECVVIVCRCLCDRYRHDVHRVITDFRTGVACYTIVVGKLNEPKLANIGMADLFCLIACREVVFVRACDA
jgi:diphthamide biosynthesis enzyme Dph1/Dph2-like protein